MAHNMLRVLAESHTLVRTANTIYFQAAKSGSFPITIVRMFKASTELRIRYSQTEHGLTAKKGMHARKSTSVKTV
jgi:hypothetical protein